MKKYKILKDEKLEIYGRTLFRIQALKDFSNVKKGDKGGWIEKEENLSQDGNCWVYGNGKVFGNGKVYGFGKVFSNMWVRFGNFSEFSDGKFDLKNENYIFCSVGEKFENEKILLYKKVNKIGKKYFSLYDKTFEYKKGVLQFVKILTNIFLNLVQLDFIFQLKIIGMKEIV